MPAGSNVALAAAWTSLCAGPIAAALAFFLLRKLAPRAAAIVFAVALVGAAAVAAAVAFRFAFVSSLANWLALAIGYALYAFVAVSCAILRPAPVRRIALVIVCAPLLAGYFVGTLGFPALRILVAEGFQPPLRVEPLRGGLECHVESRSLNGVDNGYVVRIERAWPALPFVRRELAASWVDQTAGQADVSCGDALAAYDRAAAAGEAAK